MKYIILIDIDKDRVQEFKDTIYQHLAYEPFNDMTIYEMKEME